MLFSPMGDPAIVSTKNGPGPILREHVATMPAFFPFLRFFCFHLFPSFGIIRAAEIIVIW